MSTVSAAEFLQKLLGIKMSLFRWTQINDLWFTDVLSYIYKKDPKEIHTVSSKALRMLLNPPSKDIYNYNSTIYEIANEIIVKFANNPNFTFVTIFDTENVQNIYERMLEAGPKYNNIVYMVSCSAKKKTEKDVEKINLSDYRAPEGSQSADLAITILTTLLDQYLPKYIPIILISSDNFIINITKQLTLKRPVRNNSISYFTNQRNIFPLFVKYIDNNNWDKNTAFETLLAMIAADVSICPKNPHSFFLFNGFYNVNFGENEVINMRITELAGTTTQETIPVDVAAEKTNNNGDNNNNNFDSEKNKIINNYFCDLYFKYWKGTSGEFCKKYGLDKSNFSRWTRGLRSSPMFRDVVEKYCKELNVELDKQMLLESEKMRPAPAKT